MEKLRIHKMLYINQGTANIKLKGQQEYHAIFKFDTDEAAKDFITKVKDWYYGTKYDVPFKPTITKPNDLKDETPETPKATEPARKKPGPQKGKGGRPPKTDI